MSQPPSSKSLPVQGCSRVDMSLAMLLGDEAYREAMATATSAGKSQQPAQSNKTAAELEAICCTVIDLVNARAFAALLEYATPHFRPDFKSSLDNARCCSTLAEFIYFWRVLIDRDRGYHCDVRNVSVDINEDFGHANAYMTLELTGVPSSVKLQSLCVIRWRRREAKWIGYQCEVIRGMGGVAVGE